jgi:hypothetical protein
MGRFLLACSSAALQIRLRTIEHIIRSKSNRKNRKGCSESFDYEKARRATRIFLKMRPYFPKDYLCLYDSLALIEYLALHDLYPSWTFGVKLEPWHAHCWVQEGPFVFNEEPAESEDYTAIMAI